jgi:MoxR-like ATPase
VRASRLHASVELGASPRATLALYRSAQALAAIKGRPYVLPDDIKRLAPAVLTHRVITTAQSRLRGRGAADVVNDILASVAVPVEDTVAPAARPG